MTKQPFAALACRSLLSLLLLMPLAPRVHALDTSLPDLGNSAGSLMTPKRERELGKAFMRSVRRTQPVMDDTLLTDYVQHLGQKLVSASETGGSSFDFFMIDNPQINAFAGPGGYIGIYSGLVLTTETESELAAVLAHEIAHVTQQHLLRAWESASALSIPNAALLLAAVVLGATVGGDAAAAAAIGGQAAVVQQQINFTRANEKEADRVGIDILAGAGFEARAMPAFFARMGKANRVYASKLPEFLMTHPVTTSRTADALGRAEQFPYRQDADDLRYQLARMDLVQRQEDQPGDAVRELSLMLEDGRYRNRAAVEYGIARAHLRAKQPGEAASLLDDLLAKHPQAVEFIVSRAEADILAGKQSAAVNRLRTAIKATPGSYALNVALAEAALAAGEPATADSHLTAYLTFRSDDPRVYRLLSRAADDQGKRAEGHAFLAEYYYLIGDAEAAVLQLDIALKQPGISFFDASRYESRRAELQQEVDDQEDRRSARR
ncbi:MAG: M48 family metallopeptidase [Gammaproteobacteria bacterium]|nr:M48 family metallopeptidase [Gammaproteobacteria bacterium]